MKLKSLLLWTIGALVVLVAASAWLQDDPPSTEVQQWMRQIQAAEGESQAFLYLHGLNAPIGQLPEEVGAARLQAYERWFAEHGVSGSDFVAENDDVLAVPEGPLLCPIETAGCFERLLAGAEQLPAIEAEHSLLRKRYWRFLGLDDYRTLTSVSMGEPMPSLTHFFRAQQVFNLHALHLAQAGQGPTVRDLLGDELQRLRGQLVRADSVVVKMLMARLVNRNLEWQAHLYRHSLIPAPVVPAPFSVDERSLLLPMQREFFGIALLYSHMTDNASAAGHLNLLLGFRPQMTINAALGPYRQAVELSLLEPEAFVAALDRSVVTKPTAGGLRNRIGNALLGIAGPDMRAYAGRMHDLEAKRRLLALLVKLPPGASMPATASPELGNPYYPERGATLDGQGLLCFDGPQEAAFNGRCMPL